MLQRHAPCILPDSKVALLQGMGRLANRTVVFNTNHFQEPEQLTRPDRTVSQVAFALMGL
jgi:hypothetical protein